MVLLIAVTSIAAAKVSKNRSAPKSGIDWDYLLYVSRWAGTMGYGQNLPENVTGFTLHGMWPSNNDGSYPSYCSSEDFDPNQIRSLIYELDVAWFDYTPDDNYSLWSHEWSKHGTCAAELDQLSTQYKFFDYGISLYKDLDVEGVLHDAGIEPSESEMYSIDQVSQALQDAIGQTPILTCESTDLGNSLWRVEFCYDTDLNLQVCPESSDPDVCTDDFYIPPISYA